MKLIKILYLLIYWVSFKKRETVFFVSNKQLNKKNKQKRYAVILVQTIYVLQTNFF